VPVGDEHGDRPRRFPHDRLDDLLRLLEPHPAPMAA
jgi:hypothetical protein